MEPIKHSTRVDADFGDTLIQVKSGASAVRSFWSGLIELAHQLVEEHPQKKGLLVLADPTITAERLQVEWDRARQTLQPEVMNRLGLIVSKGDDFYGLPRDPDRETRARVERLVRKLAERVRLPRGEIFYDVLKLLVHQWLLNAGPMTRDWLMKTAGCSYPTVATALDRLGKSIKRHSDRRIELRHFPRDEWAGLLAASDRVRSTMRFSDRSGQPRSPDSLLRRLQKLQRDDIGVGGVFGARRYDPDLDIVGAPRLDLSIHSPGGAVDPGFVERLDPALKRIDDPYEPVNLVLHRLYRKASLFDDGPDDVKWADPVECLLDLHEAHLEPQAAEFLNHFASR